jgi:Raf kinase inhibitor-like YbhB/YbcL family protein
LIHEPGAGAISARFLAEPQQKSTSAQCSSSSASTDKTLKNDFGRKGYGGPCPPPGHGAHRYYFTVYAVDVTTLDVAGGSRNDLEAALDEHTLGKARLMGSYERKR